ncbi:cytochrome o ubiquinol oxidase [Escherichia coli DEC2E]|nr:cytochrome o ubiquinol oxidase [Escherichia coli DEC2E]
MKTLSRHSDTAKAFAYLLKQWDALNVYCSNGWVEIDNNIAENALRGVAVGRKTGCSRVPTAVVNMRRCCTR